jgi:hypothetical protein
VTRPLELGVAPVDNHDRLGDGGKILGKVGVAALADGRTAADLDHKHELTLSPEC